MIIDDDDEYPTVGDLLYQDEVWGRPGERVRLVDMTPSHVDNLVNWLYMNAESLKFAEECVMLICPEPRGEAAADMVNAAFSTLLAQSATEWIDETPLMIQLKDIQAKR